MECLPFFVLKVFCIVVALFLKHFRSIPVGLFPGQKSAPVKDQNAFAGFSQRIQHRAAASTGTNNYNVIVSIAHKKSCGTGIPPVEKYEK